MSTHLINTSLIEKTASIEKKMKEYKDKQKANLINRLLIMHDRQIK